MKIPENGKWSGTAMSNKIFSFCLIFGLFCSLSAQSYRASYRNRTRRGTQNVSVQQQKEKTQPKKEDKKQSSKKETKRSNAGLTRFDPRKPDLTEAKVKSILEETIRKKLLEKEIASTIRETTKDNYFSQSECSSLLSAYNSLQNHFELIEVTRIKPEWYKRYGMELEKFRQVADAMYFALRRYSETEFEDAVEKFKAQQEACLKFLKEKPPRISSGEYQALFKKNTQIRQQNYLKKLKEEREAAMKRRQEMLKQLQQKNQPKNQVKMQGQTTAPRAEKKK